MVHQPKTDPRNPHPVCGAQIAEVEREFQSLIEAQRDEGKGAEEKKPEQTSEETEEFPEWAEENTTWGDKNSSP